MMPLSLASVKQADSDNIISCDTAATRISFMYVVVVGIAISVFGTGFLVSKTMRSRTPKSELRSAAMRLWL